MTNPRRSALRFERLESRELMAADFGDAPAPYDTLLIDNGARHEAVGPQLGVARDMEADGIPSAGATGDGADDDGVAFGALRVGQLGAEATVTVQGAAAGARLDAWIDFNGDGSWSGPGEQIANNLAVVNGQNVVEFAIPADALSSTVLARFRLSTAGNLTPRGAAADGEVEDYAVAIAAPDASSGQFGASRLITGAVVDPQSLAAADVDGDGDMDLLSASSGDDTVAWYENNGQQTFTTRIITAAADGVRGVYATDLDGDGDMDVLAAIETANEIAWFENNGSETFTKRTVSVAAPSAKNVFAADVDGDGDMDVLSAHGSRTAWYENNGTQTFTQRLLPNAGTGVFGLHVADVDSDGDMDVLYTSTNDDKVGWFENNGAQTFTVRELISAAADPRSVFAADVDEDGDVDVIVGSSAAAGVRVLLNDGNQAFTSTNAVTGVGNVWNALPADLNGDSRTDLLSASFQSNRVVASLGTAAGAFTPQNISTTATGVRAVIAADIDGDGDLDVAAASPGNDQIVWYQNDPPADIAGDFNEDGEVNGFDFLLWQRTLGNIATPAGSGADADGNGVVGAADLAIWSNNFGAESAAAVESSVAINAVANESPLAGGNASEEALELASNVILFADQFAAPAASAAHHDANLSGRDFAPQPRRYQAAFAQLGGALATPAVRASSSRTLRSAVTPSADVADALFDDGEFAFRTF